MIRIIIDRCRYQTSSECKRCEVHATSIAFLNTRELMWALQTLKQESLLAFSCCSYEFLMNETGCSPKPWTVHFINLQLSLTCLKVQSENRRCRPILVICTANTQFLPTTNISQHYSCVGAYYVLPVSATTLRHKIHFAHYTLILSLLIV